MKPFDVYSLFDIEIEKASGSELWDKSGKRYLDLYGGHAVISIGHSHPEYVSAISEQLAKIGFYSNSIRISLQEEVAELLGEIAGYETYDLFLCNSGAEANENAFKLASFHTGKKKILAFSGAFHGRTSLAVAATDNPKICAPVNETSHIVFLPFNDELALEKAFDDEVAAVIVEGIQGVAGVYIPHASFLQKIQSLCEQFGAVFIADEVQSGYGRSGKFFAHQYAQVKPQLITVAKGMGNGFPVAGVLISPQIKPVKEMLGTTFGGNYLACAAALSVLKVIDKESLLEKATEMGAYMMERIADMPHIRATRSLGLMMGIELDFPAATCRKRLLDEFGIFTGSAAEKNTLRILPALNLSREHADEFLLALETCLNG